ncbi:MAG: HNH endonuclease [Acidobacteriota bacterium]
MNCGTNSWQTRTKNVHDLKIRPKHQRQRLDSQSYRQLCKIVLERDGWRCQSCGALESLQVHHRKFRSHSGGDNEENLMRLCQSCHHSVHRLARMSG